MSVGCGIGLREAELPTPALLLVDFQFSIARPSLDLQSKVASRKSPKILAGNILQRFSVAGARRALTYEVGPLADRLVRRDDFMTSRS